jgi:hypothetical protein
MWFRVKPSDGMLRSNNEILDSIKWGGKEFFVQLPQIFTCSNWGKTVRPLRKRKSKISILSRKGKHSFLLYCKTVYCASVLDNSNRVDYSLYFAHNSMNNLQLERSRNMLLNSAVNKQHWLNSNFYSSFAKIWSYVQQPAVWHGFITLYAIVQINISPTHHLYRKTRQAM